MFTIETAATLASSITTHRELAAGACEPGAADWAWMQPAELVDHIEATHHRHLWDALPRISVSIAEVVSVHGRRHPELNAIAALFDDIRFHVEPHLLKEERVVFPMIRDLVSQSRQARSRRRMDCSISVMLREHHSLGDDLAELGRLADLYRPPSDGCCSYAACASPRSQSSRRTRISTLTRRATCCVRRSSPEGDRAACRRGWTR